METLATPFNETSISREIAALPTFFPPTAPTAAISHKGSIENRTHEACKLGNKKVTVAYKYQGAERRNSRVKVKSGLRLEMEKSMLSMMELLSMQSITQKIIYLENMTIDAQKKMKRYLQGNTAA